MRSATHCAPCDRVRASRARIGASTQADREPQARTVTVYAENDYTNAIDDVLLAPDDFRVRRSRARPGPIELTGFTPATARKFTCRGAHVPNNFARLDNAPESRLRGDPRPRPWSRSG